MKMPNGEERMREHIQHNDRQNLYMNEHRNKFILQRIACGGPKTTSLLYPVYDYGMDLIRITMLTIGALFSELSTSFCYLFWPLYNVHDLS